MRGTKRSVQHFTRLPDDTIGCYSFGSGKPATRWANFAHHDNPRFVSTSYCDEHSDLELHDPNTTERPIRRRKP